MYPCKQCDYVATRAQGLKSHNKAKHDSTKSKRFICDICEFAAESSSQLKRHKKDKHEGIRYSCDVTNVSTLLLQLKALKNIRELNTTV